MATKYFKYELKGSHARETILDTLGDAVSAGQVVRIHNEADKTIVYLATDDTQPASTVPLSAKRSAAPVGKEVSLDDVLRIT